MTENEKAKILNATKNGKHNNIKGLLTTLNPLKTIYYTDKERNVLWKGIVKDTPEEIQNKYFYGYYFLTNCIAVDVK